MLQHDVPMALTFDDVLLVPGFSEVLPAAVAVRTKLTDGLALQIPLLSAAMDTVTEARTAVAMARAGGMGIIHKNMSPARQAREVAKVKAAVPHPSSGRGLSPALDASGRLVCGAAIGVGSDRDARLEALLEAGVDAVVLDTAHGHSQGVLEAARAVRARCSDVVLIVGNVATAEATRACVEAGAQVIKVGIGPGSICTTRVVAGVGVPQLSAVAACAEVAHELGVTVIADGGIKSSGDVAKAIAAGADAVMLGSLFAGSTEAPGETVHDGGRAYKVYRGMGSVDAMKAGSSDRYFQDEGGEPARARKLVPEGVVGRVPERGPLSELIYQLIGGLRASMGYVGAPTVPAMQERARFVRITPAGLRESHVHDVTMTKSSPNYQQR